MAKHQLRVVTYVRDFNVETDKFNEFDRLVCDAWKDRPNAVLVRSPQVLGDTYDELVANLNKLAAAELPLVIVRYPGGRTNCRC